MQQSKVGDEGSFRSSLLQKACRRFGGQSPPIQGTKATFPKIRESATNITGGDAEKTQNVFNLPVQTKTGARDIAARYDFKQRQRI